MRRSKGVAGGTLKIDRRAFLAASGGAVAVGAAHAAGTGALAKVPAGRTRLALRLSEHDDRIVVYEVFEGETGPNPAACNADQVLRLEAGSYGPDATFALGRPFRSDATKHVVYIDGGAVGTVTGLRSSLTFERDTPDAEWRVSFETALWGGKRKFGPAPFRDFASGKARLTTLVAAGAVAKAMACISGGRLRGVGKKAWAVEIDRAGVVSLASDGSHLTAFGGRLEAIRALRMDWELEDASAPREGSQHPATAGEPPCGIPADGRLKPGIHRIRATQLAFEPLRFADERKRTVSLRPNGVAARSELLVLHRPQPGGATVPLATLTLGAARIDVLEDGRPGSGIADLAARDVVLIEALLDPDKHDVPVRLVMSGTVVEPRPREYRTAAGFILLGEASALVKSSSLGSDGGRPPTGDVGPGGTSGAKPEPTPKAGGAVRAYDRHLALLSPKRPFDDPGTIYAAASLPDRPDRSPVNFKSIRIRAVLHAIDAALEGADWSRLRFGVPPRRMRRGPDASKKAKPVFPDPPQTQGTPLDLVYPVAQDRPPAADTVLALLPEGEAVARISMARARLDVGAGGSLIDLAFGFRGLSLVLGAQATLVPDDTACGVIEAPGGTVVDTRPIVIIELPPSSVLEEAWFRPLRVPDAAKRLDQARTTAENVIQARWRRYFPDPHPKATGATFDIALRLEGEAESTDPFYALWRDFFRTEASSPGQSFEYFSPSNRSHLGGSADEAKRTGDKIDKIARRVTRAFVKSLTNPPKAPDTMRARLGGGSRLAFRLNFSPVSDDLDRIDKLAFSLPALTTLGRHEPAVARRAQVLVRPLPDGSVPLVERATLDNVEGTDVLAFQGIGGGPQTVFAHMDAVGAALSRPVESHETALELLARLVFSTSQRAIYLTDLEPPAQVFSPPRASWPADELVDPVQAREPEALHRLWSVRLVTRTPIGPQPPDMRVIATPDFRPDALRPWPAGPRDEAFGAPPYGNAAPWLLPRGVPLERPAAKAPMLPRLRFLLSSDRKEEQRAAQFRTGLSANDRHQLLLLTSAYGLPVIGKRQSTAEGQWAPLVAGSDQFEPRRYGLGELEAGHAIYAPRTLDVAELSLSSLGATFRHLTSFNPPLPALLRAERGAPQMFDRRPAFDGLSINKWEHRSQQGRAQLDRVSYEGFLVPTCTKATFTKHTVRAVVATADGGLRAILVQRMFIEVTETANTGRRLEQPYDGRSWLDGPVEISVASDGEIEEPYTAHGGLVTTPVGLAFWPTRVNTTDPLNFSIKVGADSAEAPLLFVDKVAAADPAAMGIAVEAYNKSDRRRVWAFGRAKLRYAHGRKEGDADLTTTQIVVRANGRNRVLAPIDAWTGPNDDYGFTPALEGEGRAPIFPAVERADVVLDDVGAVTGGGAPSASAYFDGRYIREGFDRDGAEQRNNPLDVFMHFGPAGVGYDMGGNGDRTPLSRPRQKLYAASLRGPLGYDAPTFQLGPNQSPKATQDLSFNGGTDGSFVSLVHLFATDEASAAPTAALADGVPSPSPAAASQDLVRRTAQNCFPRDAYALLGSVTYHDLFELVDAAGLDDILPAIEQAVAFGLAAVDDIKETLSFLKDGVLVPLSHLMGEFDAQWALLDQKVKAELPEDRRGSFGLATVFPEVDAGRASLRATLDEAIAADDPTRIPDLLSRLHVAGRRFLGTLSDLANHPAETLVANVRALLDAEMGKVRGALSRLGAPAALLTALNRLQEQKDWPDWLAGLALHALLDEAATALPPELVLLPWPDLPALQAEGDALARIVGKTFGAARLEADPLRAPLAALVKGDAVRGSAFVLALAAPLTAASRKARDLIEADAAIGPDTKSKARVALTWYEQRLDDLAKNADTPLADAVFARLRVEIERLQAFKAAFGTLGAATKRGDIAQAFGALAAIVDLAGVAGAAETIKTLSDGLSTGAKGFATGVAGALPVLQISAATRAACGLWREKPHQTGGIEAIKALTGLTEPLATVQRMLVQAAGSVGRIDDPSGGVRKVFDDNRAQIAQVDESLADRIGSEVDAARAYLGDGTSEGIVADAADLFCGVVEANDALEGLRLTIAGPGDPVAIQTAALAVRDLLRRNVAAPLDALRIRTADHLAKHGEILAGSAILAALGDVAGQAAEHVRVRLQEFQDEVAGFADGLLDSVNACLTLFGKAIHAPLVSLTEGLTDGASKLPAWLWDKTSSDKLKVATNALNRMGEGTFAVFVKAGVTPPLRAVLQASRKGPDGNPQTLEDFLKGNGLRASEADARTADAALESLLQYNQSRIEGLPDKALAWLDAPAAALLRRGQGGLFELYGQLVSDRDRLLAWLKANAGWIKPHDLDLALAPPADGHDALAEEFAALGELPTTDTPLSNRDSRRKVAEFTRRFGNQQPAPVLIAKGIADLLQKVVRGDVLALIDVTALGHSIEDRLNALIPTRRTVSYRFGVALNEPQGKSVFHPRQGTRFDVSFRSDIDLLHPQDFTFESRGDIGPFDVNLLPFADLDAITLVFGGASFRTGRGVKPSFGCDFRDFKIGPALKFLEELKKSLPIGDSGVYVEPLTWTSGLRVGYALDIGVVPLGSLSFANVSVALAADLPFTENDAIFSVSLGRRLAPFTVNATPFAGSGYLSILSTAKAIVGFEFGLEFGFGGAFTIGPLVAQGRVQAGFAVRTIDTARGRATEISGTFFAGGSASIWIFTFSACLYVRLTHNAQTGTMRGEAVYSFSFKAGFIKVSYQVRVAYGQDALGGGSSGGAKQASDRTIPPAGREGAIRLAQADLGTLGDALLDGTCTAAADPIATDASQETVGMQRDWTTYSGYFDDGLLQRGGH